MYGGILLFGIVYALSGRKIRQIPWYVWVIFGLIPIGIDGVSQLPSLIPGLPAWLPMRESTPFLRTFTGGLFGSLTAWYLYPMIEETMKDSRAFLTSKKEVITQTRSSITMGFIQSGAMRYYAFDLFDGEPLVQGIFTRQGGVSPAPWASLNTGGMSGDERENVVENRRRIFEYLRASG